MSKGQWENPRILPLSKLWKNLRRLELERHAVEHLKLLDFIHSHLTKEDRRGTEHICQQVDNAHA